ncbi:hypothetical protein MKX03_011314, partial [Papaver bracteatum]
MINSRKAILEKDIESLDNEKNKIGSEFELMNKEKAEIANDEERTALHKFLEEEKAEFVDSAIHEVLESIHEREKTLSKNEKVVSREHIYIQELQEVRQELIQ